MDKGYDTPHVTISQTRPVEDRPLQKDVAASEPRTLVSHPELRSHKSFPFFQTVGEPRKSRLERALSVFADVRAGEGVGVVLLALNVFLLLAGYNLLKPARDGLILAEGSAEVKSYSAAAQAVLLMGVVPLYGWLASGANRVKVIGISGLFFAANLVIFAVAGRAGAREGIPFFIWMGIFNVFVISQFWAFANDLYTEGQGRRLFPFIGIGASLGAWIGAESVGPLVEGLDFTPYTLMLIGAGVLLIALGLTLAVNRHETGRSHELTPENVKLNDAPIGKEGGFELIFKDRYLLWIAILTVLLNVVNTTGGYLLDRLIEGEAIARVGAGDALLDSRKQFITAYSSSIIATVNLVGFLLQVFVTSRVMKFLGVRGGLFVLPLLALVNYSIIAVVPILAIVRIGKVLENATDYSIQNTVRQALWLPTSREAKYKAKAAVDTFFMRTGDVLSAGFVRLGASIGAGAPLFAWLNVALTAVWLAVSGRIAKEHKKKTL
jgi:AAA family ATP:ADP antiporter